MEAARCPWRGLGSKRAWAWSPAGADQGGSSSHRRCARLQQETGCVVRVYGNGQGPDHGAWSWLSAVQVTLKRCNASQRESQGPLPFKPVRCPQEFRQVFTTLPCLHIHSHSCGQGAAPPDVPRYLGHTHTRLSGKGITPPDGSATRLAAGQNSWHCTCAMQVFGIPGVAIMRRAEGQSHGHHILLHGKECWKRSSKGAPGRVFMQYGSASSNCSNANLDRSSAWRFQSARPPRSQPFLALHFAPQHRSHTWCELVPAAVAL